MRESLSVKLASPLGILTISMLFWLACFVTPFNSYTVRVEPAAVLLLVGYMAAIIAGTLVIRRRKDATIQPRPIDPRRLQIGFTVILCMALVGLMLKAYAVFFVDRFLSFDSVAAYRLAKMGGDDETSTPLSQLATGVFPIALVAFVMSLYLNRLLKLWQRIAVWCELIVFIGLFLTSGGRTSLTTAMLMISVALVMRAHLDPRLRVTKKALLAYGITAVVVLSAFFVYSAYAIQDRLHNMGVDNPEQYLQIVENQRDFHVREPYRGMLSSNNPLLEVGVLTAASFTYYANHGFFFFSDLYRSERGKTPLGGASEFQILVRVVGETGISVPDADEVTDRIPQPGIYYTAFGNILLDYGVIGGLIYCFLLGAFAKFLFLRAETGSLLSALLYPYLASVLFHLPVLDMVSGGYGLIIFIQTLVCFGVLQLVQRLARRKPRYAVAALPLETSASV